MAAQYIPVRIHLYALHLQTYDELSSLLPLGCKGKSILIVIDLFSEGEY